MSKFRHQIKELSPRLQQAYEWRRVWCEENGLNPNEVKAVIPNTIGGAYASTTLSNIFKAAQEALLDAGLISRHFTSHNIKKETVTQLRATMDAQSVATIIGQDVATLENVYNLNVDKVQTMGSNWGVKGSGAPAPTGQAMGASYSYSMAY